MFCQQSDPLTQTIRGCWSIFFESKGFLLRRKKKKKAHISLSLKLIPCFSPLMCEWRIQMSREESRKNEMLKCGESLEIHLDIWSPSEGTWSKAKDTPKNENDFIMRELSLDTDWRVGTSSHAEGAIINHHCRKLYVINEYINLQT